LQKVFWKEKLLKVLLLKKNWHRNRAKWKRNDHENEATESMDKQKLKLDVKEMEFPETVFSRDIETRVIQVIILHCLAKIDGVSLLGGNLIDTLFGRDIERMKGIYVEQDSKNLLVKVRVEVNVDYGVSIPEKTDEIQGCIVSEISEYTGLHVAAVHVVVKGLTHPKAKDEEVPAIEVIAEPCLEALPSTEAHLEEVSLVKTEE
jgi:Uncharacterized protein conserved in bacteria